MRTFKPYTPNQTYLLPPNMSDWLPAGHLALFISDVVDQLDLKLIYASYEEGGDRGQPPYHPAMMMKLLFYAYCTGKTSSRKIEKATWEEIVYRVLSADQHPDHDSISEFRKRHLSVLTSLFLQVLKLCQKAGLVKLGHVSLDGTKVKANASKHKAMSYDRMGKAEAQLEKEIEGLLKQAEDADAAEDLEDMDLYIPPDRQKHGEKPVAILGRVPKNLSVADRMRRKLRTKAGQEIYRFRKAIVEPVFGQIKEERRFRRFSLRGLVKVESEWTLVCLTHNLLKLFRSGCILQAA